MHANPKGRAGEDFAAKTLIERGYNIIARNFYSAFGEVDIIAVRDDVLCFVEVKTRRENSMVSGAESVGLAKQRKIIKTALLFMQGHPEYNLQPRFDLFCVYTAPSSSIIGYDYIMGAFDGEAYERQTGD